MDEYRKQLSVYYHVLDAWYTERDVELGLFYTAMEEWVTIEPLAEGELGSLLE
jgi:hypothetical protein